MSNGIENYLCNDEFGSTAETRPRNAQSFGTTESLGFARYFGEVTKYSEEAKERK